MRRPVFLAARSLLLATCMVAGIAACTASVTSRATSGELPSFSTSADAVAARAAVVDFLAAYELAPDDGGASLVALAGSPEVEHWAAWLGVQFRQVDGQVQGDHALTAIGSVQMLDGTDGSAGVVVEVAATVSFRLTPEGGEPQEQSRSLDGLIALAPDDEGVWRIVDFTRDGVPISSSVHVFPSGSGVQDRGVTMVLDSFILDEDQWAIGVVVRNETRRTIGVEPGFVGVYDLVAEPVDSGVAPTSLTAIAPGEDVQALIAYPIPQGEAISGLRLVVGTRIPGDERLVFLDVPVRPVLRNLERSGSADASPTPAASA